MSEYSAIIQSALEKETFDITPLREKYGDVEIKQELDTLNKSRATQSVVIASLVAKRCYPNWDNRVHEVQIGGHHNLRSISGSINKMLYAKGLIPAATDYACLTPAFKGVSAPFNKQFTGSIKPRDSLPAMLTIVEFINTTATPESLTLMLAYILSTLKEAKKKDDAVKVSHVVSVNRFSIDTVSNTLDKLYTLGAGSSKLPVIVAFTLLSVAQPYLWQAYTLAPLKEHTEADKDRSCGDIEMFDSLSTPKIVIEVKHNIKIDDSIILIFDRKTKDKDVPLKFIITTAKTVKRFTENNICIDTVNGFVTTYLQMILLYEKNICSIFLEELRKQIVKHGNLLINIKQSANEILTSLLVSASP